MTKKLWIVKVNGNVVSKPLDIEAAGRAATVFVEVSDHHAVCNVTVEFYCEIQL